MVQTVYLAVECPMCGHSWTQPERNPRLIDCSWCHQRVQVILLGWGPTIVGAALGTRPLSLLGRELLPPRSSFAEPE